MKHFSLDKRIVLCLGALVLALAVAPQARAQFDKKWVSAGALHNWYSEIGSEIESGGFVGSQQDGARWPGLFLYTDAQAWKGIWIGAKNVRDDAGNQYPVRVVHAGPRVSGAGEFFPVEFKLTTQYDLPLVLVDGLVSEGLSPMAIDEVDPDLPAEAVLTTTTNTLLGLTMERRVLQFSQSFHDNYHIIEYTFTNTGNTDGDAEIELPNQTLEDVMIYLQWRWSVAKETRYVIGNATGWGINAMIDTWGDGADDNLPGPTPVRAQYAWHGFYPAKGVSYNNIGGPILPEALPAPQISSTDTLGRLGAYQFIGAATLHADTSPSNPADDPSQPMTTSWIDSDAPFESRNDAFNPSKMDFEYKSLMTAGHKLPSHAYVVEPSGLDGWKKPTADPSLGTSGGFSAANGYGPYTLAPGESVRIVIAEAMAGLSRDASKAIGHEYKLAGADENALLPYDVNGRTVRMTKNEWVFTGRDSLYQTFLRAMANYESGYQAPPAPRPPSELIVNSGGDRITLNWKYPAEAPNPAGFEVYRARNRYDSTYTRIANLPGTARTYEDTTPVRGVDYYYYLLAVGNPADNTGGAGTPAGVALRSSQYYTQTYTPANLKRLPGQSMEEIRIVPNPFHMGASTDVRWADQADKLAFFGIPGRSRIQIFTEIGELVDTIEHTDGSGDAIWDHTTSSRQVVASGVYIAVITDLESGERAFRKFIIIR